MARNKSPVKDLVTIREHVIFAGVTQTGKTTLARHQAALLVGAGYEVVVYDPVGTETANGYWPEGAEVIETEKEFADRMRDLSSDDPERPIFVFVDEAADIFHHRDPEARAIPRRCRHDGIYLRMICQRPTLLHPDARTQCSVGYVFRLAPDDARIICAGFGHGAEVYGQSLDKGDFLVLESGSAKHARHNLSSVVSGFDKPRN